MAAHTLAPADYSPDRNTPKAAVAMLAAVAIFGLWRGFAREFAAERIGGPDAPAADAYSPRAATALPAVAAGVDTLIPPEAEPAPAASVANAAKPKAAALDVVVTEEAAGAPAAVEPDGAVETSPGADAPTLQAPEDDPAPPVEDEPPPDDFDPYN